MKLFLASFFLLCSFLDSGLHFFSENLINIKSGHSLVLYTESFYIDAHFYGFQIPPSTQIGKGLYIGHWGTIVVNGKTIMGDFCNLSPGVTIGQTNRGKNKGVPTIGSKVWIGTNAVIVGNIIIGDNVMIAPNAFVNISVPSNSLVVGNPASILPREDATEGYINFTIADTSL